MTKKKCIAIASLMLILGICIGLGIAGMTWLKFVDEFAKFPYNQGLFTGAVIFEEELYNQCPDFNVNKINPEYYAVISAVRKEHGSDSINCWLIDIGEQWSSNKGDYGCEIYNEELRKARELLK